MRKLSSEIQKNIKQAHGDLLDIKFLHLAVPPFYRNTVLMACLCILKPQKSDFFEDCLSHQEVKVCH